MAGAALWMGKFPIFVLRSALLFRKMATREKPTQSLKSASGAGFDYEDQVAAMFLVEMLAGQPNLLADWGPAYLLQRQVSALEPHGDIVLWFHGDDQRPFRCAISVKSAPAHSSKGFGPELVNDAWRVLQADGFDQNYDFVGLAIPQLGDDFVTKAHELTGRARSSPSGDLEAAIRGAREKEFYEHYHHPSDPTQTPSLLLRKLVIRDSLDFLHPVSVARNTAVKLCAGMLTDMGDSGSADSDLWRNLVAIAARLRRDGGDASVASILAELGGRFAFRDSPHDLRQWSLLRRISDDSMQAICTELPGGLHVPRVDLMQKLSAGLLSRAVAVTGPSGSGKSALVKSWAETVEAGSREVVWITKGSLTRCGMSASELAAVLLRTRKQAGILVIDGLEHWHTEAEFAFTLGLMTAIKGDARWRVIVTCQEQDWERIQKKLSAGGKVILSAVQCGQFEEGEVQVLRRESPRIATIAQSELSRIMRLPHMLRVILESSQYGEGTEAINISISSVVQDWWQDRVCGGLALSPAGTLAKRIAVRLADELEVELPEDAANGAEEAVLSLIRNGVLRRTAFGTLHFAHDLYADWSRIQHLRPLPPEQLYSFGRTHVEHPPWFRSFTALCRQFLEMDKALDRWRYFLRGLREAYQHRGEHYGYLTIEPLDLRLVDAALEGLLTCSRLPEVLQELREDLLADGCLVLGRLLLLMKLAGSIPDPFLIDAMQKESKCPDADQKLFEHLARLPRIDLWEPVISFLHGEKELTVPCLSGPIASIIPMFATLAGYLRGSGYQVPKCWPALAELAVMIGEQELKWEIEDIHRMRSDRVLFAEETKRRDIYSAALMAADCCSERVVKLALKAAGRAEWEEGDLPPELGRGWNGKFVRHGHHDWEVIEPTCAWKPGPCRKTSREFSHAWLCNGAAKLASMRPEFIEEVTMAFLIDWPRRKPPTRGGGSLTRGFGFKSQLERWYPPFWHHGPFLVLLRHSLQHGLSLVVNLVNFAAERIAEWWPYQNDQTITVELSTPVGRAEWKGHSQVFDWNVYNMNTTEGVTCSLMALEKWFLDELAAGKAVTEAIHYLYLHGRSLAFAGLLISVGKAHPELLMSELSPLLPFRRFYIWDQTLSRGMLDGGWFREPEIVNRWRQEWRSMPHRSLKLLDLCHQLLLKNEKAKEVCLGVASIWRAEAHSLPDGHPDKIPILRWASDFDAGTWVEVQLKDGTIAWMAQRPPELQNEEERQRMNLEQRYMTLPFRCSEALNVRQPLNAESCSSLWVLFEELNSRTPPPDDGQFEARLMNPQHSLAGVGALLLCLGESWVQENPVILKRLEQALLGLFRNLQPIPCFSPTDSLVGSEEFLARAAVRLWAMRCNSRQWRGACAYLACAERYGVAQALLDEAFRLRDRLGAGFDELCGFVTARGIERQEPDDFSMRQQHREHLEKWRAKWAKKFAAGKLPPLPDNWWTLPDRRSAEASVTTEEDVADEETPWGRYDDGRALRLSYGFDPYFMLTAFSFIPTSEHGATAANQGSAIWQRMDDHLFHGMLHTILDTPLRRGRRTAADTYDSDHKIIDRVAQRTLNEAMPHPDQYWRALMAKGPNASGMITHYISSLRIAALRAPEGSIVRLIPIWHGMIEQLQSAPAWRDGDHECRDEVFEELLFVGRINQMSGWDGDDTFAPLILSMAAHYESAVKKAVRGTHKLECLLGLLASVAARKWLPQVFDWCHDGVMEYTSTYWDDRHFRHAFSRLLEAGWRHSFSAIRGNERSFACFKRVATALAAAQDPIALEVQQALGQR